MTDIPFTRLWAMRIGFAALVCVILFFHLLPLESQPGSWVGPNLLIGFAFAWSLRQPEYVPTLALAVLFLLADLILQRPPGLWASLALLACERLKGRSRGSRERSFVAEWLHVCIMIAGITLVYRAVLIITLLDLPPFGLTVIEAIMTMVFYPVVVAITHGLMGVRKSAPGDSEKIGSRI